MIERIVLVACCLLAACSPEPAGSPVAQQAAEPVAATVTGTLTYRERMALTPAAIAEVWLQDTSLADAPAVTLAHQLIEAPGNVPIGFSLRYDPDAIDERRTYGLRATIREGDRLLFTTDRHYPVLTNGAGTSAELMLVRASTLESEPVVTLADSHWQLTSVGAEAYVHEGQGQVPALRFSADGTTVSGYSGCNQFSGSVKIQNDGLTLGPLAATQRACVDSMETESRFLAGLARANRFETAQDKLTLLDGDVPLLGFSAVDQD